MTLAVRSERKCNERILTQSTEIAKRMNAHLHAPDEQAVSCYETKIGIKRKGQEYIRYITPDSGREYCYSV